MIPTAQPTRRFACVCLLAMLSAQGCCAIHVPAGAPHVQGVPHVADAPRELDKVTLPAYRIEPPDVLSIDVAALIPEEDYPLAIGDTVLITVIGTLPNEPIAGIYPVEPGGIIQLGYGYGAVQVAGLTNQQAREAIREHLRDHLRDPRVVLSLRDVAGVQPVSGEHLVGPDGTVTLGKYGTVSVVGQSIAEAQQTLQQHLSEYFKSPEVSISVFAYNSKVYYVVTQGAGLGDSVVRLPFTGNETVMDAISQVDGLSHVSSTQIWIARPGRNEHGGNQILPVDWLAITQRGEVDTNFQLLPGDRLYIAQDPLMALDGALAKVTAPLERVFGFTLLGTGTVSRLSGKVLNNGGNAAFVPRF